jgi:hypothetical protein
MVVLVVDFHADKLHISDQFAWVRVRGAQDCTGFGGCRFR